MLNRISIIGSGNVATHLAKAFFAKGYTIAQIYSRDPAHAAALAEQVGATAISNLSLVGDTDLCVIAVTDEAIPGIVSGLKAGRSLVVHTSGSTHINVLGKFERYGVLYPLQTFTASREIAWNNLPVFIEANSGKALKELETWAACLSGQIHPADSALRLQLHIAAVFACNFTNYLLGVAADLSGDYFALLQPLVKETIDKAFSAAHPALVQTGPAARNDQTTINKQVAALPREIRKLYNEITKLIQNSKFKIG